MASLDVGAFRLQFPEFSSTTNYTNDLLNNYYAIASVYISQSSWCSSWQLAVQTQTLLLMTAHMAKLNKLIGAGEQPNILTNATIDKISITVEPPPSQNSWQYWLQTTPYGMQLLSLLQVSSAGGFFGGGFPVRAAFRQ